MKTSDVIGQLAAALVAAQAAMEGARKASKNPAFNSKYADLESVVDAIKGPLTAAGISYVQFPCTNDKDEVGVETMLMHASGEWIRSDPFYVPVKKADAQGFGSAITYCRRYSLLAACGIAPEDDDGNAAAKSAPDKKPLSAPIPANVEGQETFANMPAEEQQFLRDMAMELMAIHKDKGDMVGWVEGQNLQTEEKLALWTLLPSDLRSAYKKQQRERTALATQA